MKMDLIRFDELKVGDKFIKGNGDYYLWQKIELVSTENEHGEPASCNASLVDAPWIGSLFRDDSIQILCTFEGASQVVE